MEHERSTTVRTNPELAAIHAEEYPEIRAYYLRKWGGDHMHEVFTRPFDDPVLDCTIPWERVHAPYGPKYDRIRPARYALANADQHGADAVDAYYGIFDFYKINVN